MLLDDIADYLSSGGVGTVGTNIFKGYMPGPPAQDVVVAIYETGGRGPVRRMGEGAASTSVVVQQPRIQVVCRAAIDGYAAARQKAKEVYDLIEGLPTRSINGVAYKWGAAVQEPFLFGRDEAGRALIACNYDIVKERS